MLFIGVRGQHVNLPPDFLRINRSSNLSGIADNNFIELFSDPLFLREMERELGPNYEVILREHVQAHNLSSSKVIASEKTSHPTDNVLAAPLGGGIANTSTPTPSTSQSISPTESQFQSRSQSEIRMSKSEITSKNICSITLSPLPSSFFSLVHFSLLSTLL